MKDQIEYLASIGENQRLEYKQEYKPKGNKDEFLETIVAFANAEGGILLIGVDDQGGIRGCGDLYEGQIHQIATGKIEPYLEFEAKRVEYDGRPVIIVEVPEGETKPYYLVTNNKSVPYTRRNSSDFALKYHEIVKLYEERLAKSSGVWR